MLVRLIAFSLFVSFINGTQTAMSANTTSNTNLPNTLRLATTNWCPYSCTGEQEGIVAEYISVLLSKHGIRTDIKSYPFTRAIAEAHKGKNADGLLTAVPAEAPDLLFTNVPTMSYQVCFFTSPTNNWTYENSNSLYSHKGLLGYIAEYSYGEVVDTYLRGQKGTKTIMELSGSDAILRLLKLMQRGRVNIVVEDKNIVAWTLAKNTKNELQKSDVKLAGCLPSQPFFIGLNKHNSWSRRIIEILNTEISDTTNAETLNKIKSKYFGD